jgi:hypothetical protein
MSVTNLAQPNSAAPPPPMPSPVVTPPPMIAPEPAANLVPTLAPVQSRERPGIADRLLDDDDDGPSLGPVIDDNFDKDEPFDLPEPEPVGRRSTRERAPEHTRTERPGNAGPRAFEEAKLNTRDGYELDPLDRGTRPDAETKIDLITIAGLAQWSDRALKKIGKENFETLMRVSELTGRISEETRNIILALVPLFEGKDDDEQISAKEIVSLLAQLDGLTAEGPMTDTRMVSFLLQDQMDFFPSVRR